jgi:hypothetical protein
MRVDAFPEGLRARLKGLPSEQPSDDGAEEFLRGSGGAPAPFWRHVRDHDGGGSGQGSPGEITVALRGSLSRWCG